MNRLTPLDRPAAPWWSLVVATVLITMIVTGCLSLISYDLGMRHGVSKAVKAWECDKRGPGIIEKTGYPDGTVKCTAYQRPEKR